MADTKLSALTAITAAADTDELYVANTGTSKRITWANIKATLKTYFDTLYQPLAANLTSWAGIAPAAKQDALVSGTNIKTINSTSILGAGDIAVTVDLASPGPIGGTTPSTIAATTISASGRITSQEQYYTGTLKTFIGGTGVFLGSSTPLGWSAGGDPTISRDTYVYRDGAGTLAQRNSTNAQTFRTYGTYTDASNYRRVALSMTTAGVASITPEGAGTGASGNVLHISGLPTSNPGPGILWNNAGTPAIGT